jgi:hypothetical protein
MRCTAAGSIGKQGANDPRRSSGAQGHRPRCDLRGDLRRWLDGSGADCSRIHCQARSRTRSDGRQRRAQTREAELVEQTRSIVDDARQTIQTLERSIVASDSASRGLQDAARRAVNRCTPSANPAAPIGSPGAILPGSMSDGDRILRLLGELDGFAGAVAADSGRARAARNACEAAYTAAMKATNQ